MENYLFSIAAKKVSLMAVKAVVALLSSVAVASVMSKYGVSVDQSKLAPSLTVGILAALEWAHDYAKVKYGWKWI